jgi:ABC-type sugar transport system substrate-binding protein
VAEGDFTEMGGYIAMRQLLRARPDAVFAASDMMAIGALRALTEAGLRVPQDVSLVGFDDIPAAAHTAPPLTTVRQPTQRMGALAVETLIDRIENPTRKFVTGASGGAYGARIVRHQPGPLSLVCLLPRRISRQTRNLRQEERRSENTLIPIQNA